ncbi:MAG TPA: flagellar basal body rod protein FlgC [Terracidiphilus sp.]|nr:flagellar basal body rod protein FlgC [Terracidiphilus sp.]
MNLFGMMDASGEAMQAERVRAEVVAANMANAETTRTATGGPYHRQHVIFAADSGDTRFLDSMGTAAGPTSTTFASASESPALSSTGSVGVAPGVHIAGVVEDPSPGLRRYDPGHPDAGPDGYVEYPDINPIAEMVDLMGATRAYGLNSSAVQAEKGMISSALEIAKS